MVREDKSIPKRCHFLLILYLDLHWVLDWYCVLLGLREPDQSSALIWYVNYVGFVHCMHACT